MTPHTLRHSYATGLLESGVDLLTLRDVIADEQQFEAAAVMVLHT